MIYLFSPPIWPDTFRNYTKPNISTIALHQLIILSKREINWASKITAYYLSHTGYFIIIIMTESQQEPDVLQCREIKPHKKHRATVIFLHVFFLFSVQSHRSSVSDPVLNYRDWEILVMVYDNYSLIPAWNGHLQRVFLVTSSSYSHLRKFEVTFPLNSEPPNW